MKSRREIFIAGVVIVGLLSVVIWRLLASGDTSSEAGPRGDGSRMGEAVAVEMTLVERRDLGESRVFTGSLEAEARFAVVAQVSGRLMELGVDLGDRVERDQVVARLEDEEFTHQLRQAKAAREVAEANIAEAESSLLMAERELERIRVLRGREIAAEAELEVAETQFNAAGARLRVARGTLAQREAGLATAELRVSQTAVRATWKGSGEVRAVSERYVSEGAHVSANERLLEMVNLGTLRAVIFVTERDYALIRTGQEAAISVDAYRDEVFVGRVARVAPVFHVGSRQAQVELTIENEEERLAPGMFARVRLQLREAMDAASVPRDSVVRRNGREGVFRIDPEEGVARFIAVELGIRDGDFVQIRSPELSGMIVTLGQGQLTNGSRVRVIASNGEEPAGRE